MKDRSEFDALLEGLARAGLISIANDTFRNPEGKDITYKKARLRTRGASRTMRRWIQCGFAGRMADAPRKRSGERGSVARRGSESVPAESAGADEVLFEQLRGWRKEQARPTKTPAFMILSDAVLRAIAQARPSESCWAACGVGYGAGEGGPVWGCGVGGVPRVRRAVQSVEPRLSERASGGSAVSCAGTQGGCRIEWLQRLSLSKGRWSSMGRSRRWSRGCVRGGKRRRRKAGLPSFFVLSDTALRSIVWTRPKSLDELRGGAWVGVGEGGAVRGGNSQAHPGSMRLSR